MVALAPRGVTDFADDRRQLAVGLMAIEKTHRVERQAPAAGLGQQADRALRHMPDGLAYLLSHGVDQAYASAGERLQVIGFSKRKRSEAAQA
ncbi:hypothetical protein D3C84_1162770 [compost metagenome]